MRGRWGPSPRGRGNHASRHPGLCRIGTIPARAGKPQAGKQRPVLAEDHPRAGGETYALKGDIGWTKGPSPRGRGNHLAPVGLERLQGTIPARAGKPQPPCRHTPGPKDHPRAGGETVGEEVVLLPDTGPSPRGRGNPGPRSYRGSCPGTIPARAGKPHSGAISPTTWRDHPRAGGETGRYGLDTHAYRGPSPRGRGNRIRGDQHRAGIRTIPARAGKPIIVRHRKSTIKDHPRAGGETCSRAACTSAEYGPSPRGRGNPGRDLRIGRLEGTIPARAGKPAGHASATGSYRDHPRAGGETMISDAMELLCMGPSPRGRGNLSHTAAAAQRSGTIPARAGKPRGAHGATRGLGDHPRAGGETATPTEQAQ